MVLCLDDNIQIYLKKYQIKFLIGDIKIKNLFIKINYNMI